MARCKLYAEQECAGCPTPERFGVPCTHDPKNTEQAEFEQHMADHEMHDHPVQVALNDYHHRLAENALEDQPW